jgi:hypothetical protein
MLTGAHVLENTAASDKGPLTEELLKRAVQAGTTNEFFVRRSVSAENAPK